MELWSDSMWSSTHPLNEYFMSHSFKKMITKVGIGRRDIIIATGVHGKVLFALARENLWRHGTETEGLC